MQWGRARLAELAVKRALLVERISMQRLEFVDAWREIERPLRWADFGVSLAAVLRDNWRVASSTAAVALFGLGPWLPRLRVWLSRALVAYQFVNWLRAHRTARA